MILNADYLLDDEYLLDGGSSGQTFRPPTDLISGPINPDTTGLERRLMGYFPPAPRGRNVWVLPDGTFTEVQPWPLVSVAEANQGVLPIGDTTTVATYVFVYLGGHEYPLSDAEAAALTAAGYGDFIT